MRARGCARGKKIWRGLFIKKKGPRARPAAHALGRRAVAAVCVSSVRGSCLPAEGAPQNRPNAFFFGCGGGACFLPKREPPEAFVAFFFGAGVLALNLTVPGRW